MLFLKLRLSELGNLVQFAQTRSDNPRCSHHKEKEIPTGPAKKVEIFWTKTGLMRLKCFGLNAPDPLPLVSPTFGSNAHSLFPSKEKRNAAGPVKKVEQFRTITSSIGCKEFNWICKGPYTILNLISRSFEPSSALIIVPSPSAILGRLALRLRGEGAVTRPEAECEGARASNALIVELTRIRELELPESTLLPILTDL